MRVLACLSLLALLTFGTTSLAAAQTATATPATPAPPPAAPTIPFSASGCMTSNDSAQWRLERVGDHTTLSGQVEVNCGQAKIFADQVDIYHDSDRLVATGNVVFADAQGRISAERAEFNTKQGVGTFTDASGILSLGPKADR